MSSDYAQTREFESKVRSVAEGVWGLQPGECQPEHYTNDPVIRELDGLARLRDIIHVIMATTSTKLEKVRDDVKKLTAAARIESASGLPVSKWLITSQQLEAEHLKHAREKGVIAITLQQFRARFFDGRDYVEKRRRAAFGSARNLANGTISIPEDEYVELPLNIAAFEPVSGRPADTAWSQADVKSLAGELEYGRTIVMMAPFGSGKSLTAREIFLKLGKKHLRGDLDRAPVALNLREHWGSLYADEILERHARSIALASRDQLTIAWRTSLTVLIVDGFDEVASQAIARGADRNFMREARSVALQAVRDLVRNTPAGTGLLLCGRDHYFDNLRELEHALGLTGRPFAIVRLDEFTEEQAIRFLRKHSKDAVLPDWLPRKPLILGYLAHQGLLAEILAIDASQGFGFAWDAFLSLVCEREASHDRASMDAQTVRRVLERLGSDVRGTSSGTGPITGIELAEAYRLETGDTASEGVLMQLQRLPGLTPREQDPTARSFVDEDLLSALQGSAIARIILEGSILWGARRWQTALSSRATHMAAYLIQRAGGNAETALAAALRLTQSISASKEEQQVVADVVAVALELSRSHGRLDGRSVVVDSASLGRIDLEDLKVDNLFLRHCIIDEVVIGPHVAESSIKITDCLIARIAGVSAAEALPADVFSGCVTEEFDDASTNSAVMRLKAPAGVKALASILRKLYMQAGGGRKLSAFKRGVTDTQVTEEIDPVLRILESEGMVAITNDIAHPIRKQTARARRLLAELTTSQDEVIRRVLRG